MFSIASCALRALPAAALFVFASSAPAAETTLVAFDSRFDVERLEIRDVRPSIVARDDGYLLRLETGHRDKWPGITILPSEGHWDASDYLHLVVELHNRGEREVHVGMRADTPNREGPSWQVQQILRLGPGERGELVLPLTRGMPDRLTDKLFGMRGYPGQMHPDRGIDPSHISQILIFSNQPSHDNVIEAGNIRAGGEYQGSIWFTQDADDLLPMIDRFGQYMHKDWPGKTDSKDDLQQRRREEAADLDANPGPSGWNQYGGWQAGPELRATGRFRAQKHAGKWWLVDPTGHLFWSHGIDCVRPNNAHTPITDRKFLFADLPSPDSPLGQFHGQGSWAPHGYYQDKGSYQTFDFSGANLLRKYGNNWRDQFNRLCHQRLRSWGMNTIANWSDADVYRLQQTPYVVTVGSGRARLEGSQGYWGKFPDPFDPEFAETTQRNIASQREAAGSAWCIGVFVDNELAWGDELSLAQATLASPPDQAAKQQLVTDLRAKYDSIERLNDAWKSDYRSWDDLLQRQTTTDAEHAREDLAAFYTKIAEQYFQVCRDAVQQTVPGTLYLGCRFAWVNERAIRAAAKYCDVIGFNKYTYSVADFELPEGLDSPVIIGEFHFGALDRGMLHTGLRRTENQTERAAAYKSYVRGALENPFLVGTHWFQFGDQATTGRGDGENYQIGFLDVCDTPYPETIQASRHVGAEMYRRRLGKNTNQQKGTGVTENRILEKATFGNGCFWCIEAVFKQLDGVANVVSGYSGGQVKNPTYQQVCTGTTGHAEVIQVDFDPEVISYQALLEVFWKTHDPTTLNRQGNDVGPQYRSAIFYHNEKQRELAEHYKQKLDKSGAFDDPIVTEISPFTEFYPAEDYHQNYYALNPNQPYCAVLIRPKLEKFRQVFADKLKSDDPSGAKADKRPDERQ